MLKLIIIVATILAGRVSTNPVSRIGAPRQLSGALHQQGFQRLIAPFQHLRVPPPFAFAARSRQLNPRPLQYLRESRQVYTRTIANSIINSAPSGAKLIAAKGDLPSLMDRLISNATFIRPNITDTFTCDGRVYGYYADQDNECQIFHICVPMKQLFPDMYNEEDIFQFSFICPAQTVFTQDAMVCAWRDSAFPCYAADQLYDRNNHFFIVPAEDVQRTPTEKSLRTLLDTTSSTDTTPEVSLTPSIVSSNVSSLTPMSSTEALQKPNTATETAYEHTSISPTTFETTLPATVYESTSPQSTFESTEAQTTSFETLPPFESSQESSTATELPTTFESLPPEPNAHEPFSTIQTTLRSARVPYLRKGIHSRRNSFRPANPYYSRTYDPSFRVFRYWS